MRPMNPPAKVKICYVIGSLDRGGTEGQLLELINGIDRDRFEICVVVEHDTGIGRLEGLIPGWRVLHGDSQGSNSTVRRAYEGAASFWQFCSHLTAAKPEIVHALLPVPSILAAGARLIGKAGCVIVSRRSLVNCYRPHQRLGAFADIAATRAADLVVGNCQAVIREVISVDGVAPSRTCVIYNGVDTDRFSPGQSKGLRQELGWTDEHFVFGMIANFIPYKRHDDFVRAAAIIKQALPNARFLLVGADRGHLPAVKRRITETGLGANVKILEGTPTPEMAFAAMDAYVCSSETEGFSNVLLEAMASELPVIATDVGGNREAVADGYSGWLVPSRSPARIAEVAIQLATDPARRHEFGRNGRCRAEALFSIDRMVRDYQGLYTRLLCQTPQSPWARLFSSARVPHATLRPVREPASNPGELFDVGHTRSGVGPDSAAGPTGGFSI
jgi:glycosyltransferase involved in cell wall biosynthesis